MQDALDLLWTPAQQMFMPLPKEELLVEEGLLPRSQPLREAWDEQVRSHLQEAGLQPPAVGEIPQSRRSHTPHLEVLLRELQSVARSDPQAEW